MGNLGWLHESHTTPGPREEGPDVAVGMGSVMAGAVVAAVVSGVVTAVVAARSGVAA